ncbi:MarR family transcriptional regulator [Clostridium sp. C105KSO13]|uniref:MarR family transcriptional regulator n=1 Tax=Clostridium sp. C105KSO13 TaxID=1776045 RepID=UPI0007408710|nr:helix-turn-helix domain-containing protein [Clostridium sp. C105KSO13]CUX16101.1 MarR family protein [Clostridium sp. C105KSO13]
MNYQLELKQIVDFPRCRIYRGFIQTLISDKTIRTNGCSYLFYYLILCSYANYRTSYRRMEHLMYTVGPGEWICTLKEVQSWFRCKFQHQAISILNTFEERGHITYTVMGKEKLLKFKITDWPNSNKILEYNYPCEKDTGFFFFPIAKVHELIDMEKCSEMDIMLDMWIHAIYNDPLVFGSDSAPVVYYRNNTGNPLTSFQTLANRWGQSKASVSRILKKLEDKELITLISFKGKYGSMIYLNSYLSVMFDVSDVMIDKEEIAMKMQLPIHIPEENEETCVSETVTEEQITVSENGSCVPDSHMKFMVAKVAEMLDTQGIPCCHCRKTQYILSPLSAWKGLLTTYTLSIICPFGNARYRFELSVSPEDASINPCPLTVDCQEQEGGE